MGLRALPKAFYLVGNFGGVFVGPVPLDVEVDLCAEEAAFEQDKVEGQFSGSEGFVRAGHLQRDKKCLEK
jgi:hypothetical protein